MSNYLFINYKLYPQGAGERGVELTKKIAKTAEEYPHVQMAVAPQAVDLREVAALGHADSPHRHPDSPHCHPELCHPELDSGSDSGSEKSEPRFDSGSEAGMTKKEAGMTKKEAGMTKDRGQNDGQEKRTRNNAEIEVWGQHADPVESGRGTGYITPSGLKEDGACGVFLNHSEHLFENFSQLEKAHQLCKKHSLKTMVFAPDISQLKKCTVLDADFYAIEPPELIASTETSVSEAEPETIKKAVQTVPKDKLIVGAGIKSKKDVQIALKLGACGVAVASDIVKAEEPGGELRDLLEGFSETQVH